MLESWGILFVCLSSRTQRVQINAILSNQVWLSIGCPQGCVLLPLVFILYTNMCQSRNINSWLLDKDTSHGPILDETYLRQKIWGLILEHILINNRLQPLRVRQWNEFTLINISDYWFKTELWSKLWSCELKKAPVSVMLFPYWKEQWWFDFCLAFTDDIVWIFICKEQKLTPSNY